MSLDSEVSQDFFHCEGGRDTPSSSLYPRAKTGRSHKFFKSFLKIKIFSDDYSIFQRFKDLNI